MGGGGGGGGESHFNVLVESDGQSPRTVSTNHNLSEEKGEPKRYRTEVLPHTNLTPYRYAKPYAPSYYILKPLGRGRPSCAPLHRCWVGNRTAHIVHTASRAGHCFLWRHRLGWWA